MAKDSEKQQDKREIRRKRRIRNQILAYLVAILFVLALLTGVFFGVKYLLDYLKDQKEANESGMQEQVEEMIGEEENIEEPTPKPVEPIPELSWQDKIDMIVNARIQVMPLEDKIAALFIVTPEALTGVDTALKAGDGTKEALGKYAVGGIIYQAKNIEDEAQFKEMIQNTRMYSSYPLFLAMADEGGEASPLVQAGLMEAVSDAATVGQSGDAGMAYQAGLTIGAKLAGYGINLNLAPVADLNNVEGSVIGNRSYGSDPNQASPYVQYMIHGLKENNVDACLKHFPGIGSSTQSTDDGLASTERSAEDFRQNEFQVFQSGIAAGASMVMVSNMSAPALAEDNMPCSLSSTVVTHILRGELGYNGVVITDAMNSKAISEYYSADQAAVMALRAGCDMILMPEDFEKAYNGVLTAVNEGDISIERINDSLMRIYRIKDADKVLN